MSITKVDKPWGYELHWAKTDRYVGKVLHVKAGYALSLQTTTSGRDDLPWTGKILRDLEGRDGHDAAGGERAHHAAHDSSHDSDRRQRYFSLHFELTTSSAGGQHSGFRNRVSEG